MVVEGDTAIRAPRKTVGGCSTDHNQISPCAAGVGEIEEVESGMHCHGVESARQGAGKAM